MMDKKNNMKRYEIYFRDTNAKKSLEHPRKEYHLIN